MACLKRRGKSFYAQFYSGGLQKRVNLNTTSLPSAKEKLRQIESSLYRGEEIQLPTRTPIPDVLERYIDYMKTRKTAKSVERHIYYLRQAFGQVSPSLRLKNINISAKATKRPASQMTRPIEAVYFEQVSTSEISEHISAHVGRQALAAKTANRYREILTRLYNWSMLQGGIIIPGDRNLAAAVERYKERASEISFLSVDDIQQQLDALIANYSANTIIVSLFPFLIQ
jgi:hypothetical protein